MTDVLRIAHPQDYPLEDNPDVGNPEIYLKQTYWRKFFGGNQRLADFLTADSAHSFLSLDFTFSGLY